MVFQEKSRVTMDHHSIRKISEDLQKKKDLKHETVVAFKSAGV